MKIIKTKVRGYYGSNIYRPSEHKAIVEEFEGVVNDALKYDRDIDYEIWSEDSELTDLEIAKIDKIKFIED